MAIDYTTKPYAQWLEEVLPELVEIDPVSIGIVMLTEDGMTGTVYYNADREDMAKMRDSIEDDRIAEWFKSNAVYLAQLLGEEDFDDDELSEDNPSAD